MDAVKFRPAVRYRAAVRQREKSQGEKEDFPARFLAGKYAFP
jgi:hypothetical protein